MCLAPALARAVAPEDEKVADRKAVTAAQAALALDLLARLPAKGNLFFSPESISTVLGMTALGAKGKTSAAFEKVLHVPSRLGIERFHAAHGARPAEEGEGFVFHSANRLFAQRGFRFDPAFEGSVARVYGGGVEALDFKADANGAREAINAWGAKETMGKIPELLPPGVPSAASRLVLANAVYFKATWEDPFEASSTEDGPFLVAADQRVTAKFMRTAGPRDYVEDERCQLVALPYTSKRFEAVFLLPRGDVGAFAESLTTEKLDVLRAGAKSTLVSVAIPRIHFEWGKDLAPELGALGLDVAFGPEADFSGIAASPSEPFHLGAVIHRAIVALDEEGTEAAAATAVEVAVGAMRPKGVLFEANRPFLFLIRDRRSGAILFLGRVADPTSR